MQQEDSTVSSIAPQHRESALYTQQDVDRLLEICKERHGMAVNQEEGSATVALNLPDSVLHNLTIFHAMHSEGRWWKAFYDHRFMPGLGSKQRK